MKYLLLVALVGLGFAQQPANTPEVKESSKPGSAQVTDLAKAGHKNVQATMPMVSGPKPSTATPQTATSVDTTIRDSRTSVGEKSRREEDPNIQGELALFTGLLVLVGLLQVIAIVWQGCVLTRTLGAIKHQAHEMKRQRILAREQLVIMQGQLGQMESAGKQTDQIIAQAPKQVSAAEGQVRLMETSGTHTEDLARQAVNGRDIGAELKIARPLIE